MSSTNITSLTLGLSEVTEIVQAETWLVQQYWASAVMCYPFYDYILTFAAEVDCVWRRPCSAVTVLFLLNRYLLLVSIIYVFPLAKLCEDDCSCLYRSRVAAVSLYTLTLLSQAAFVSLRIYAIWSRSLVRGLIVFTLYLIPISLQTFWRLYKFQVEQDGEGGCQFVKNRFAFKDLMVVVLTVLADSSVLGFTIAKSLEIKKKATSAGKDFRIIQMILGDGSLQFFVLFILNVFRSINVVVADFDYISIIALELSSILTSHFVFHLRQVLPTDAQENEMLLSQPGSGAPSRRTSSKLMGNIGAPLHNMFGEELGGVSVNSEPIYSDNPLEHSLAGPSRANYEGVNIDDEDEDSDDDDPIEAKLGEFFEDKEYAKGVLRYMKRGNTLDDTTAELEKVPLVLHGHQKN